MSQVDFPAITICGSGRIDRNLEAGFWNLFLKFLNAHGMNLSYTALQVTDKMTQVPIY